DEPLDNRRMNDDRYQGRVHILAQTKPDPILVGRQFIMDRDHWLGRGVEIPGADDPQTPGGVGVDWGENPRQGARAAADDPTLADPVATRKRVADQLTKVMGSDVGKPSQDPNLADVTALVGQVNDPQAPANLKESLDKASQADAPDGKTRAVVQIA